MTINKFFSVKKHRCFDKQIQLIIEVPNNNTTLNINNISKIRFPFRSGLQRTVNNSKYSTFLL
jgi:hypothetical protein